MATDLTEIIRTAAKIKDETVESANTASRVGGCLLDLAAFAAQGIFADEVAFEAAADGVSVRLRYHNAQGQPYERRAFIPALNPAADTAGVLTPAQYRSIKAFGAVYEVGVFTGTSMAWEACAAAAVAGNSSYRVLKYTIGTNMYYIEQSVRDNFCTQYLYEGQQRFIRTIRFASNDRTQVQNVGAWAKTGAQSISYTPSTRELRIKDFNGEDIGTKATLPEATTSAAGLFSVADKKKLNAYASTFAANPEATTSAAGLLSAADKVNLNAFAYLGAFASMDAAGNKAATVPYAGNADFVLLRFRIGGKGGLILQNVNGASTEQYLFYNGKRYVRYVDFTSADRTAVKTVQDWKSDGVAYIFYEADNRIIYLRNQWDENISGDIYSTLPLVSSQYAGLLSPADKEKLDACVTTDATYSARGLMTAQQVSALDGAAQRTAFGVFEGTVVVAEGSAVVPETSSTTSTSGKIVFVTRIGMTPTATVTRKGFLYQVGTKYYMAAPSAYGKPMPMDNGLAISTQDGCAYYLSDDQLVKAIPVATTSQSGLMSSAVYSKLNTLAQQAENIHLLNLGTFDTMALAENAAAALNVCSNPLFRHVFYTVGSNSFHITQQVENDWCVQTLYMGRAIKQRYIRFTSAARTAIAETQSWQHAMVRNLHYNASSQQLQLQSPWDDNVGSAATIPTVSSSVNGLAPKEWPARLAAIEQRIATLENKVKALEAAAATSTADTAEAGE